MTNACELTHNVRKHACFNYFIARVETMWETAIMICVSEPMDRLSYELFHTDRRTQMCDIFALCIDQLLNRLRNLNTIDVTTRCKGAVHK